MVINGFSFSLPGFLYNRTKRLGVSSFKIPDETKRENNGYDLPLAEEAPPAAPADDIAVVFY
jgi:hypothetical protein